MSFLKGILQDTDHIYSSKRAVILMFALLLGMSFISNLFWGFKVEQFMFDGVMYVVIAGFGFTGAERFAPKIVEKL